ncbi:MAG: plasmid mobilization relaxosome protein MobC [Synergistota bacterium]|nr:plasmid mobilization relaxosome protein MobC [Synergistota bacterium]
MNKHKQKSRKTPKNDKALRRHCISVRLSPQENAELDRRRGAQQRGRFIRNLFLGRPDPKQIPEINRKAYIELARAASNLNQIARALNRGDRVILEELIHELQEFRRAMLKGREEEDHDSKSDTGERI